MELEAYLDRFDGGRAQGALQRIRTQHSDNPQVMQTVFAMLNARGMVPTEVAAEESYGQESLIGQGVDAAQSAPKPSSKIWTPDSEPTAKPKSAIWTP